MWGTSLSEGVSVSDPTLKSPDRIDSWAEEHKKCALVSAIVKTTCCFACKMGISLVMSFKKSKMMTKTIVATTSIEAFTVTSTKT